MLLDPSHIKCSTDAHLVGVKAEDIPRTFVQELLLLKPKY